MVNLKKKFKKKWVKQSHKKYELKYNYSVTLKALDTFGYCQRPVFSLGVSKHA